MHEQYSINHYKIWKVRPVQFEQSVPLEGEFDSGVAWKAELLTIDYLGNPVDKNDEGILRKDHHLVVYRLQGPPQPLREVTIHNQFHERETLRIGDAEWLMIPAEKTLDGVPQSYPHDADHYACYRVIEPVSTPIKLMDQFDQLRERPEWIHRFGPAFFAVPVSKKGEPIHWPHEYLTIYQFCPDPFEVKVATLDQFGVHKLDVIQSEYLAVPSRMLEWRELAQ